MSYPLDHFPHLNGAPPTVHPVISGSQNDRSSLTDENVDWDQLFLRFQDDVDEQTWAADTSAIGEAQSQSEHPAGSPGPELDLIGAGDLALLLEFLNEPVLPVPLPSPQPQQDEEDEPLLPVPPPQPQQDEEGQPLLLVLPPQQQQDEEEDDFGYRKDGKKRTSYRQVGPCVIGLCGRTKEISLHLIRDNNNEATSSTNAAPTRVSSVTKTSAISGSASHQQLQLEDEQKDQQQRPTCEADSYENLIRDFCSNKNMGNGIVDSE